jgi:hypothetical protein
MAQIVIWRRAGLQPAFHTIPFREWYCLENGKLQLKPSLSDFAIQISQISAACKLTASIETEVAAVIAHMTSVRPARLVVRGKNLMEFFVAFLDHLRAEIPRLATAYQDKPLYAKASFGQKNAHVHLLPRARAPQSLREFVRRTYGRFVYEIYGR